MLNVVVNLDDYLLIAGFEDSLWCSYRVFGQGFVLCYRPLLKQTTGLSESPEGQHGSTAGRRVLTRIKRLKLKTQKTQKPIKHFPFFLLYYRSFVQLVSCDLCGKKRREQHVFSQNIHCSFLARSHILLPLTSLTTWFRSRLNMMQLLDHDARLLFRLREITLLQCLSDTYIGPWTPEGPCPQCFWVVNGWNFT